ncbi:cobalt-precorrin-6A reductase [Halorhodospira abdelmalekii]|nr:cobalt-precorrin-6A reductase [Halorhodospira abdelmalekii]MBK1734462.1 cobalt-precorrin-6A reductase [Halorhodospira abdelmalekii]
MLILGGTTEAMALARALEGDRRFAPTYSVAGRTGTPRLPGVPCRSGGFGGIDGLVEWLQRHACQVVVDATHPFAAQISAHAAAAAERSGARLLVLRRPAWNAGPHDCWYRVADMAAAAAALGEAPQRVLLTIGRLELSAFCSAPQHHYIARLIELPEQRPPRCDLLQQRGPFRLEDELALFDTQRIDLLVTKNAGGTASQPKLEAARRRRVPVIMVERPPVAAVAEQVNTVEEALCWLGEPLPPSLRSPLVGSG